MNQFRLLSDVAHLIGASPRSSGERRQMPQTASSMQIGSAVLSISLTKSLAFSGDCQLATIAVKIDD
jgi:hypothetical protein